MRTTTHCTPAALRAGFTGNKLLTWNYLRRSRAKMHNGYSICTCNTSYDRVDSGSEFPGLKTTVFDLFWAVLGAYKRPPYILVYFLPRFVLISGGSKIKDRRKSPYRRKRIHPVIQEWKTGEMSTVVLLIFTRYWRSRVSRSPFLLAIFSISLSGPWG